MALAIFFMMLALLTGIFRLMTQNGIGPLLLVPLYGLHPLLMVFGFIAGIIMTERIAGIELLPASKYSRLSVSMVPLVFAGITVEALGYGADSLLLRYAGATLLVIGGGLFLTLVTSFYRKGRENLSVIFMIIAAISLLLSSALSSLELPGGNLGFIMLLLLFPIVFILGERVELTSLASGRQPARLRPALATTLTSMAIFALESVFYRSSGLQLDGFGLVGFLLLIVTLGLFLREERTRSREASQDVMPLQRYVRLHVTAAYLWGLAGAIFGVMYVLNSGFAFYDAFIHSLALGFIGLMFLAHGPIILPMVVGRSFSQNRLSYIPLALLTFGIALRVSGSLSLMLIQSWALSFAVAISGWVILIAVVAFFIEILRGITRRN